MAVQKKRPIQVYLRPEQIEALRSLARRRKVAVAELVRQGIDRLLAEAPAEEDPLWGIVGLVEGGPSDLAEQHDRYLTDLSSRRIRVRRDAAPRHHRSLRL